MEKILVIDDEESILSMMRLSLEADGYEVLTARDGVTGLEIFEKELPEAILLDVRMPETDGLKVLSKIMSVDPDSEVIMITGHGDMAIAVECMQKQASNFLTKPVSDEMLSIALKRSLERRALKAKLKRYTAGLETLVREANQELEKAYQFRENLIESSPDAIVSIRKGGEIIIFNSAAEQLLGYTKDEVIGKMSIADIYPPSVAKKVMADLRSNDFGGPGRVAKRELTVKHKNGHEIPVYLSAATLFQGGQEAGSMGIFTDLSQRKRLEKQLLRTEKLSSLGKLAAGIAHEINQPLTGVLTFASLLKKKFKDDEQTRKDLEIIVRETTRIRGIVQGVLDFGRETPMSKSTTQIQTILERTLEILVHQERFFGIDVKKEYDPALPYVIVDSNLMEQVFMNIILNAADAMNGSGTLTLRTRHANGGVEIHIADTGKGMPPSMIDKIFDPFFTTKDSTEGMGMGLGLAVSYGIVNSHNGDIQVTTQEGQGTTFTIRLPTEQN